MSTKDVARRNNLEYHHDSIFATLKIDSFKIPGHVLRLNDNRWTGAVKDLTSRNVRRTTGGPSTQWSDFFTKSFKER
ncbi:hypothetical protein ANCDUO_09880 [Ancylostoma duodenale]|uniref:Uncharacterized protein n=1 Tax=Ancylostoma duodenale TaxID=51022 RepID=A0A0C2CSS2_9BILA|nr:hypothetical protein ANCDUO_09880 [Ancylostoma duodenale]